MTGPEIRIRRAAERGVSNLGWLDSRHTFSFADYWDPAQMGFSALRVINDDRVAPGKGFGTHPHRDMEIISVVVEGALEHRDSLGTGSVIRPGEVQRMSAGTGILHSEFNPSPDEAVRFLQIWIEPERPDLAPSYEQRAFAQRPGALITVASPDGRDGSLTVHQDVTILRGEIAPESRIEHHLAPGRHAWLQVVVGSLEVSGHELAEGDGLAVSGVDNLVLAGRPGGAEVLLFDLP